MPQLALRPRGESTSLPKHVSLPFSGAEPVDGGPLAWLSFLAFSALLCVHKSSVLASTPTSLPRKSGAFHSVTLPVTMSQSPATRNGAWHLEVLGKYWSSERGCWSGRGNHTHRPVDTGRLCVLRCIFIFLQIEGLATLHWSQSNDNCFLTVAHCVSLLHCDSHNISYFFNFVIFVMRICDQ